MESLRTSDLAMACTRAAYRNAEVEALFEKARYDHKRQAGTVLVVMPTPEEQQYIREAVRALILEEDDTQRLSRPPEQDREGYDYVRSIQYDKVVEGLHSGRVAWGAHEKAKMADLLGAVGVRVEPGTPAWDVAALNKRDPSGSCLCQPNRQQPTLRLRLSG